MVFLHHSNNTATISSNPFNNGLRPVTDSKTDWNVASRDAAWRKINVPQSEAIWNEFSKKIIL